MPSRLADRDWLRFPLVGYVATLPLISLELFTLGGKSVVPSDLFFLALLIASTGRRAWKRPTPAIAMLAALPPLATIAATLLADTAGPAALLEIARTTYSVVVLLALACIDLHPRLRLLAVRAWTLSGATVCIIGLAAFAFVVLFGFPANALARPNSGNLGPHVVRVSGVLETNALVLYLLMAAACATYLARSGESAGDRRLGTSALLLMSITVLLALSRGALGYVLALALMAWRSDLGPPWLRKGRMVLTLAVVFLLVAVVVATLWAIFPISRVVEGRENSSLSWNRGPNAYRVLHKAGLRMFAAHPLHGVGPGHFGARFAEFTANEERATAWPPMDARRDWAPHSMWIGSAAEGGVILLGGWLIVLATLGRMLLATKSHVSSIAPYVGLCLVGVAVNGFYIDFQHLKFIWAALGTAFAHSTASKHEM